MAGGTYRRVRELAASGRRRLLVRYRGSSTRAGDAELVALVAELLAGSTAPRVAVASDDRSTPLAAALTRELGDASVVVVPARRPGRHLAVVVAGPFDLVLDPTTEPRGRLGRFEELFHQLTPGGHLVIAGARDDDPRAAADRSPEDRSNLGPFLDAAMKRAGRPTPGRPKYGRVGRFDEHAVGNALVSIQVRGRHLVLTSRGAPVHAKLSEHQGNRVISLLPELGHSVLETVPGREWTPAGELRVHAAVAGASPRPKVLVSPAVYLRDYRDVVVAPGQIVADDRVLWPDTFRHNASRRLRNRRGTVEVAPGYARLRFDTAELPVLEGTYYHLDNEARGHFGHLLTEQVSRTWAWPMAKELVPDLKAVVGTTRRRPELQPYELAVYAAAGIPAEDVVLLREPVRVERLLSATPMLSNPDYVHPAVADTWRRVGDALAATATGGPRPARIFVSRRLTKRACNNTEEVEEIFRAAGFEVIFPEDHPLGDQVAMFRSASVVAGYAGSGMFNLCFVPEPTRVIILSSEAYVAQNERLIAAALGHRIDSIKSVPDTPGSFHSSFTLDLDREGRHLAALLADLDGTRADRKDAPAEARSAASDAGPGDAWVRGILDLTTTYLNADGASVVLVGDQASTAALRHGLGTANADARVDLVDSAALGALHVRLAGTGRHDVIVDAAPGSDAERAERARDLLLHLRVGGLLVVADARRGACRADEAFGLLVEESRSAWRDAPGGPNRLPRDGWGRAVDTATLHGDHLAVVNGLDDVCAKVREEDAGRYLDLRRGRAGRVLAERPGTVVENPAEIRMSQAAKPRVYRTRFEAPAVQLRSYADAVCWPGGVVTQRNVLLPESYRHFARRRMRNRFVEDLAPAFGRISDDGLQPAPLPGAHFHLDSEFRGHFGHALTEQLPRLWAWQEAKQEEPDLRALLLTNGDRTTITEWEYQLYEAAGIARRDLVLADRAVHVERLLAATPMFSQPDFVHGQLSGLYRAVGDRLAAAAPDRERPERIFCSRRGGKRSCHNVGEVEEFFAGLGFEIVYPEDHPLGEQVRLFREAREVAGFSGSAMFTLAFATEPTRVILVSSESYRAQNETMIAALHGHQVNVAWCRPDTPLTADRRRREVMHSAFTFDVDSAGAFIRAVVADAPDGSSG